MERQEEDRLRALLESELDDIERAATDIASWSAPVELDQQSVGRVSRVDALQRQAMSQAVARRNAARATLVRQALRRMEEGEFGYCVDCGDEIAPRRLAVDPAFARCIRCAR